MRNTRRTILADTEEWPARQQTWSGRGLATIPRNGLPVEQTELGVGQAWDGWSRGRDRSTPAFCVAMICREPRGEDL
jgi:hypothetical protein